MSDISDLPLKLIISGRLRAGGDDLARMEVAASGLDTKATEIANKKWITPEQRRRQQEGVQRERSLLGQAIMATREHVRADPDSSKNYEKTREELAKADRIGSDLRLREPTKTSSKEILRESAMKVGERAAEIEEDPVSVASLRSSPPPAVLDKSYPRDTKQPPVAAIAEMGDDPWLSGRKPGDGDISGR